MARTGLAHWFLRKEGNPVLHDESWREAIKRHNWNHMYLSTKFDPEGFDYGTMGTTNQKYYPSTHHIMNHTYSAAAGCSSYHYNVYKPLGNTVTHGRQGSINFDGGKYTTFNSGSIPKDERGIPLDSSYRYAAPQGIGEDDFDSRRTISCPPIGVQHFNMHQQCRGNTRRTIKVSDHTTSPHRRRVQPFNYVKHERSL